MRVVLVLVVVALLGCAGDGLRGDGGGAASDDGGWPSCVQPFDRGGPCASEGAACMPPPECRACIGGAFRLVRPTLPTPCLCQSGNWRCVSPPSSTVVDCVVEQPVSCARAQDYADYYADSACTQHLPCSSP